LTKKLIYINRPDPDDEETVSEDTLQAHGTTTGGVKDVSGELWDKDMTQNYQQNVPSVRPPPDWEIDFDLTVLDNNQEYTVVVKDAAGEAPDASSVFLLQRKRSQTKKKQGYGGGLSISYPLTGSVVYCDNLIATGSAEKPVSGTITIGPNAYNANQVTGPPPPGKTWTIQFVNMTPGTGCLYVVDADGNSAASTGLTFRNRSSG
jgi:hypothetical protein